MSEIGGSNLAPDTFAELWIESRSLKRHLDEASSRYRTHRKRMEKAGVDLKALALLEQLHQLDDDAALGRVKAMLRMAAWLEMPLGAQPSMFPDPGAAEKTGSAMTQALALEAARQQGYDAGRRADDVDENPHDNGTEAAVAWRKGWDEGQRANLDAMAAGEAARPNKPRRASSGGARTRGRAANRLSI